MATHNEVTGSLGNAAEAVNGHDLELDSYNGLSSPRHEQDSSDDRSDLEHNNTVSVRKCKRSHSDVSKKSQPDDTVAFAPEEDGDSPNKRPSRVLDTNGRHKRSNIGSAFSGKRISDELDSDDELIMNMREDGFTDRQIAQRLQKEGRVRYDENSISTRIVRIRQAKAEKVEFLIKEGYKAWEYEEDKLLLQAYSLADIEINYEIERVRAWRFRKVSDYMRRLNKNALFSANACRERYNALVEGTARIPIALDDDPEARRAEMEAYRITRETTRHKEQAEEALKEATKAKLKAEKKSRKVKKTEESANKRARKASEEAQRTTQRAEKARIHAARATEIQDMEARCNTQIKQKDTAQTAKKSDPATPSPTAAPTTVSTAAPAGDPAQKTKTKPASNTTTTSVSKTKTRPKPITPETPDPRANLSFADLKKLCNVRSIDLPSKRNKTTLLQALRNADERHSLKDLKSMCLTKGLNVSGPKPLLKYRLALAAARGCASFGKRAGARSGPSFDAAPGAALGASSDSDSSSHLSPSTSEA